MMYLKMRCQLRQFTQFFLDLCGNKCRKQIADEKESGKHKLHFCHKGTNICGIMERFSVIFIAAATLVQQKKRLFRNRGSIFAA